jgi:HPt (histidine-containing phosphotransfer) domain-containing protein
VSDYFDVSRISNLEAVMGTEAGAIVATMLRSMTSAIEQVESATVAGELDLATRAAHAARNDALMVGAGQLQEALTELEAATRRWDGDRARVALERIREVWPPTRDGLAAVAESG